MVQKAYLMAQDLRADPFVIKRPMQPTPEALVPVFLPFEREREKLDAQMVVGYGQVRTSQHLGVNLIINLLSSEKYTSHTTKRMARQASALL